MKFCSQCQREYSNGERYCSEHPKVLLSLPDDYSLVGRDIDRYHIEALVGIGGMGAVYSALDSLFDCRRVAFKILLPQLAYHQPHLINEFEEEGKRTAKLKHENVVEIFDAGKVELTRAGQPPWQISFIVMEWLEGRTLAEELIETGPFSFERTQYVLQQIADGLAEAHDKYIIHRDLKPSNIMLIKQAGGPDRVKLVDFGIAKEVKNTAGEKITKLVGTPGYASPEQWQPGVTITHRADIYALGVILFELLTSELPFKTKDLFKLLQQQSQDPPPALREHRPDAPAALERLINQMLQKDPDKRPELVSDIPAQFKQALSNPNATDALPLISAFEFDVVTLEANGKVGHRSGRRNYFSEYLGLGKGVRLEMVAILGGTFLRGSPEKEAERRKDEGPQQQVTISPFWMGKNPITQAQWRAVAGWDEVEIPLPRDPAYFEGDTLPVENISWEEANEFCQRLGRRTARPYRLPSEAEWEYACRAGTIAPFNFGEDITPEFVNFDGRYPYKPIQHVFKPNIIFRGKTLAVGDLSTANNFGLYGMHGNVWEWCQDWYASYSDAETNDPRGPATGQWRVLRGGSYQDAGKYCRSAKRNRWIPSNRAPFIGFRLAVTLATE